MSNQVTPSIASNDIIVKISCQELIDFGYYMGDYEPQDKFDLHINISKQQIKIAPDVDGADFDNSFEFDYEETLADLNLNVHLSNGICVGVDYSYNDLFSETSRVCEFWEIALICGLSHDELSAFESIEHLSDFASGAFSFSYEHLYICEKEVLESFGEINVHIDMDVKKITCFNSRKGIYETISFGEACIEDTADEADLKEYFEETYPDNVVNVVFL